MTKNTQETVSTSMAEMLSFGKHLKSLMDRKKVTQDELATLVHTTQPTISHLINGTRKCSMKMADKLSRALNLDDKEQVHFFSKASQPKSMGLAKEAINVEANFIENMVRLMAASGIRIAEINLVTLIESRTREKSSMLLVMRDGTVYDLYLDIKKRPFAVQQKTVPSDTVPPIPEPVPEETPAVEEAEQSVKEPGTAPQPEIIPSVLPGSNVKPVKQPLTEKEKEAKERRKKYLEMIRNASGFGTSTSSPPGVEPEHNVTADTDIEVPTSEVVDHTPQVPNPTPSADLKAPDAPAKSTEFKDRGEPGQAEPA